MFEFCTTLGGEEYIVRVKKFTPADHGRTWGRPEDCRPPSGAEADFDLIDELTGAFADETACRYYDDILDEIEEQAYARADDYEGA